MSQRPNIFEDAPGELSQDAFIAWLLRWSDSSHKEGSPGLHRLGRDFLVRLVRREELNADTETTIVVKRQLGRIDVLAEIGSDLVLVVEDKVHAQEHGDQLDRYRNYALQSFPNRRPAFAYVKTGSQSCYSAVERSEFSIFLRRDFRELLQAHKEVVDGNAILADMRDRIERIEERTSAFRHRPVVEWKQDVGEVGSAAWTGLYEFLQREIARKHGFEDFDWGYVPNARGGFLGAWWGFLECRNSSTLYPQIEQGRLVCKLGTERASDDEQLRERHALRNLVGDVFNRLPTEPGPKFKGSARRMGQWMTIAQIEVDEWLKSDERGLMDVDATLERLKSAHDYIRLLCAAVNETTV